MDGVNYVLHTNEIAWVPKKDMTFFAKMKPFFMGLIVVILVMSIVFRENILSELNWSARILLIILFIKTAAAKRDEEAPSPIDLVFYDDRIVLYRPYHYHSRRLQRREWQTMYYRDIEKCVYRAQTQKMCFFGTADCLSYDFTKDGRLSKTPSFQKHVEKGLCYFYTKFCTDVDLAGEIEAHSPIKVIIEDN